MCKSGSRRLDFVLLGKSKEEMDILMQHCGEPLYRSKQILDYLERGTKKIDEMYYVRNIRNKTMIKDERGVLYRSRNLSEQG